MLNRPEFIVAAGIVLGLYLYIRFMDKNEDLAGKVAFKAGVVSVVVLGALAYYSATEPISTEPFGV